MMPENTKTKDQKPKTKDRIIWLSLFALVVAVYFFGLTMPLVGPDEPRYAQVAREMCLRGDWITPTLGGFDWFEKPALLYWLQIAAYKIFGVSEFAARFGSAMFGLGTIFSLWILGKFAAAGAQSREENAADNGQRTTDNFANWLALVAATSSGLLVFARGASFDIVLTFPITAALVAFFIFDQSPRKSGFVFHFSLFTFHFFVGVALLAKGLIGIVFPLAIVAFFYLLSRRLPSKIFVFSLFWGTVLSLAVAAIWYLPMYQTNGWKFIDEFFIQHHFERFTSDKYKHYQPFWFFFVVLPLMTIPWLPFFLAALWNFFGSRFSSSTLQFQNEISTPNLRASASLRLRVSPSPLLLFAFSWLAVPLVFFSLSGSKLPGYVLPALPGAIILTAGYVFEFASKSRARTRASQILAAAILFFVIVVLQFFAADYAEHETVKNLIETANAKGFRDKKIVSLYTVSHNLEFYAAGRLIREPDGKLKRYDDFSVLLKDLEQVPGRRILVVVPQKDVPRLIAETSTARFEPLAENGESAIVAVSR